MGWLRTQRDIIGLVAIWGLLLQGLAIPFASGLHAAALSSDDDFALVCATPGASSAPGQTPRNGPDCQCPMACHAGCGGACGGGLLSTFARVVLPGEWHAPVVTSPRARIAQPALAHDNGARAPPANV